MTQNQKDRLREYQEDVRHAKDLRLREQEIIEKAKLEETKLQFEKMKEKTIEKELLLREV